MLTTTIRLHSGIILTIWCVGTNGVYRWQNDAGEVLDVAGDWYADERATIHGATCHLLATAGMEVLEDSDDLLFAALALDSAMQADEDDAR